MQDDEVKNNFNVIFREWIYHDIQSGIEHKQNYLVALGLLSYLEFLGGLITGNGGIQKQSVSNFNAAIKLLPLEYQKLDDQLIIQDADGTLQRGIYAIIRCGLVHEYGIKSAAAVYNNPNGLTTTHIGIQLGRLGIPSSSIEGVQIYTNELFRDFKKLVETTYAKLLANDRELLDSMKQVMERAGNRKWIKK